MDVTGLRIALYSGNYNYVRDGANQALNRLVGYLLRQGAAVRVYAPTTADPAFEPTGDLVSVPSVPIPMRSEYRFASRLSGRVRRDLERFDPNIVHIASPDRVGHRMLHWARARGTPALASVHTRFETYLRYYNLAFVEPFIEAVLRRFYRKCDAIVAPSESMAQLLRQQRMSYDIGIWSRGVDRDIFHSGRRDLGWRRALGVRDEVPLIAFLGRVVMEKGLDVFSDAVEAMAARDIPHAVLVIGDGPARPWLESRLPSAHFVGHHEGESLGRALASSDLLFNPSVTETFGNVTLEAMACALPVVASRATGSQSLVDDGRSGRLVDPGAIQAFAEALAAYCRDPELRKAHGAAGEARAADYSWDRINGAVADTYLRLIRQRGSQD